MEKEKKNGGTPLILCLDTATDICSVALTRAAQVVAYRENGDGNSHARILLPFVEEVLKEAAVKPQELAAVAVSMGPGSYTGLRIGTSTAKGLCYALEIPLIAIPTLQIIAAGASKNLPATHDVTFCPMLDARRMEVFTALYDRNLQPLNDVAAVIVDENTFAELLENHQTIFCGNGAGKCRPLYENHSNAIFDLTPVSARNMAGIALKKFTEKQWEDLAYFTPLYGKDYVAAKPTVKGLH
ncbi:MAG: tRNA (adenosine(37)-N6)-threonylcarbamoyltransferase complex dimerization subunit type 1 TsaB [Bacteroidales bacterium]|nr:tRNA (adenosine(37)-N6)-threonylcarbamoyltransferase complex dimerization subunit type 1 TsaB [Bacteroidales bacterium]